MNLTTLILFFLTLSYSFCIAEGDFILKSGHFVHGSPLGVDSNNVGTIKMKNEIQKIPTRLFTKKGLQYFLHLSHKNKDFVIKKEEGTKGYKFTVLDSFFALNQEKSKAQEPIFVYVNPDGLAARKITDFIAKNQRFSTVASYFDKRIFIPKVKDEFQLIKQVMKIDFPGGIILNIDQANIIHSKLNTVEDVLNVLQGLKSTLKTVKTSSAAITSANE
ncbi:hypothetical protein MJH12_17820 [bacterium]|nr:hypothetical protein [bacterium]